MTTSNLRKLLVLAVDENTVVFDSCASIHQFTRRLISEMQFWFYFRSHIPTDLYLPYSLVSEVQGFISPSLSIHLIHTPYWRILEEYYKDDLRGTYAAGDDNLVMMSCEGSDQTVAILGSY